MGKCISKLHKQRYERVSNLPGHRITGSFMLVIGLFMWVIRAPMRVTGAPIRSIELPDRLFNASSSVNYFVCKNKFLGNFTGLFSENLARRTQFLHFSLELLRN